MQISSIRLFGAWGSLRTVDAVHDARGWESIPAAEQLEPFPVHVSSTRAAIKPHAPDARHLVKEAPECSTVPGDAEVVVVTVHLLHERFVLLAYGKMAVSTTPVGDALKRAPEATA